MITKFLAEKVIKLLLKRIKKAHPKSTIKQREIFDKIIGGKEDVKKDDKKKNSG